jgi:hypothetical protein
VSDDYKKRARALGEKRKEKANFTISEGQTCFRLGPVPAGKTSPAIFEEYQVHEKVGAKKKFLRCGHPPNHTDDENDNSECWLCDKKIPELKKKKKMSRVEALLPVTKLVVQASKVIEDDDGKPKYGAFKPWTPSPKVASTLLTSILGNKKRDYVDRKRGYNLNIERTGTTQFDTRYGPIEPDDEPSTVPKALIAAIQPFDSIRGVPKYNEKAQKAAYAGQEFDWREAENDSESDSESESDSSEEAESGLEDVLESESDSKDKKKKGKNKMAVKSTKKAKPAVKESESDEPEESESSSSESESSSSESESESESKDKKKKKKTKKQESESSESASESDSESSESSSDSESASESESESEEKKPAKKTAAKKTAAKKKAKKK